MNNDREPYVPEDRYTRELYDVWAQAHDAFETEVCKPGQDSYSLSLPVVRDGKMESYTLAQLLVHLVDDVDVMMALIEVVDQAPGPQAGVLRATLANAYVRKYASDVAKERTCLR